MKKLVDILSDTLSTRGLLYFFLRIREMTGRTRPQQLPGFEPEHSTKKVVRRLNEPIVRLHGISFIAALNSFVLKYKIPLSVTYITLFNLKNSSLRNAIEQSVTKTTILDYYVKPISPYKLNK